MLIKLTQEIKHIIKKKDQVGRWGGEEFAIFLPNASLEQAYRVAQRISTALSKLVVLNRENQAIPCPTISQGIAELTDACNTIECLVDQADRRLYKAKARGRNQIEPVVSPGSEDEFAQAG